MLDYLQKLNKLYDEVFDKEGNVKKCGRDKCRELIVVCARIDRTGTRYGDLESGMMDIEKIKDLYSKMHNK